MQMGHINLVFLVDLGRRVALITIKGGIGEAATLLQVDLMGTGSPSFSLLYLATLKVRELAFLKVFATVES